MPASASESGFNALDTEQELREKYWKGVQAYTALELGHRLHWGLEAPDVLMRFMDTTQTDLASRARGFLTEDATLRQLVASQQTDAAVQYLADLLLKGSEEKYLLDTQRKAA